MGPWIVKALKLLLDHWIKAIVLMLVFGLSFGGFHVGYKSCHIDKKKITAKAEAERISGRAAKK